MNNKLLIIFTLLLSQFSALALHQDIEQVGSYGDAETRVEVYSADLDQENPGSEKNKQIIQSFKDDIGLDSDAPLIVETVNAQSSAELGITPLTEKTVVEFAQDYKLDNPIVTEEITSEAVEFMKTGVLPLEHQSEILEAIKNEKWSESAEVKTLTNQQTKASGIAGKFGLSKSTKKLTVIRMVFNGTANTVAAFLSKRHFIKAGALGLISSIMTGSVQVNNKWFEKLMASKYAKLKFFGIEAAFVGVSLVASSMLGIKEYTWLEYAIDIFGFGIATTLTQGRAEELAAKQVDRLKDTIDKEIIRTHNSTELSAEAKKLLLSRLITRRANLTETFSRVMLGGSMIWSAAIALGATLPGAAGVIASYSVFGLLHIYANTIKYVGSDKMMNFHPKNYQAGMVKFFKAQVQAPGKALKYIGKKLRKMANALDCSSNYRNPTGQN